MKARTLIVGSAALVIFLFTVLMMTRIVRKNEEARLLVLNTPTGGDFSMPSTEGVFATEANRGRVLFLFFGFVRCPQICPMTIANLSQMLSNLPAEEQNRVKGVFVTVDPERDSLEVLRERLATSKGRIIGARDTDENLEKVLRLFGGRYSRLKADDGSVVIDHTTRIYVINGKGDWVETLDYNAPPEELARAAREADSKAPVMAEARHLRDIEILGENEECDLAKGKCVVRTLEGEEFEMELGPAPITVEKELTLRVRTTSTHYVPMEADFEGISLNMGLIRPKLTASGLGEYEAQLLLPLCELPVMKWRVQLLVKETQGPRMRAVTFGFETLQDL